MTVLLGTLWNSIKQIESPYVFDWENTIALDTMQGNRASSRREGKVSYVFSCCGRLLGYILEYGGDAHSKREFVSKARTPV